MKTRKIENWIYISEWQKAEINNALADGFQRCNWSNTHFVKTTELPMHSSQTMPKFMGGEPDNGGKYNTYYYIVTKEQFEAMAVKPQLSQMCRPIRLKNYDSVNADIIQNEKNGLGWEEEESTFDKHYRYVYFIE